MTLPLWWCWVIGFIMVNADVVHCFVFANKAIVHLSTVLTTAYMDSNQDRDGTYQVQKEGP